MGNIFSLLGGNNQEVADIMGKVNEWAQIATTVVISIIALVLVIYSIYIGFRLAKAEDDGKRKDAKQHLIYALVGLIIMVAILALINTVIKTGTKTPLQSTTDETVNTVLNLIAQVVSLILTILVSLAAIFAVYIGWRFISAEDEGKRTQAKKQLIYTIVGLIAIVAINAIATTVLTSLAKKN